MSRFQMVKRGWFANGPDFYNAALALGVSRYYATVANPPFKMSLL